MARAWQALPLSRHTDDKAGSAPGVGEGPARDESGTSNHFLHKRRGGERGMRQGDAEVSELG
jgi:hypothetical protein